MQRDFPPARSDALWVADFTYVATWTGFVYVAFVLDALSRRILGWRAATSCAPSTREWANCSISLARYAMGLRQRLGSGCAWWEWQQSSQD